MCVQHIFKRNIKVHFDSYYRHNINHYHFVLSTSYIIHEFLRLLRILEAHSIIYQKDSNISVRVFYIADTYFHNIPIITFYCCIIKIGKNLKKRERENYDTFK